MSAAKSGETFKDTSKGTDVRTGNILAAKGVADAIRTSLGPRGMDKMIENERGEPIITNDGATILSQMQVFHPTAKMLVELSKSQDIEAGDGTTSVVVLCGALLDAAQNLLHKGIHPTVITESFQRAVAKAEDVLTAMADPVDMTERDRLVQAAVTSLSSKVVKEYSEMLAPLAVDSVLSVAGPDATNVDLRDIRIVKALGGTLEDTEMIPGLAFNKRASHVAGAPTRIADAKIGLIQFCLSAPKTDIENTVVVSEYAQMDRILREERKYILSMCKKIAKSGCNVLLIQKSILRDAVNDLSLHFLAKLKILVVRDIERDDIEFISRTLDCKPVAHVDSFTPDKLGRAGLVEEVTVGAGNKIVKMTDVPNPGRTVSVVVRGSNQLVLDETDRSLHDALCVVRSLVKKKFLIVGAGAPEIECALELSRWSKTLEGAASYCIKAFAEAMEIIPYTLAENAGMHPIAIVTELRKLHAEGQKRAGINVRRGTICDITEEQVVQPLLVSLSAISLATETVNMVLKIDDMCAVR